MINGMIISFYKLMSIYLIIILIRWLYLHNFLRIGAPMDLITKDLLINFLFILLSLCLAQILYMSKYSYQLKGSNDRIIAIFPVISIILCMLFPVYIDENFVWDLRWIPFILGGLYGGYKLGTFLLLLLLIIRYFQGGGDGFYITVITFSVIGIIVFFLSKRFLQMTLKQKIIVTTSITFFSLLSSLILSSKVFLIDLPLSFWLQYFGIHVIGTLISTLLWEVIRANSEILQKLIKAEKLQTVSHLAASMSHEVRNPLTAVRGFIQLLSEDISTYSRKDYADIALSELDRATEVINDYLTFAKPILEKEEKLNANEEIQHAVNIMTPLATMNGIQLKVSLPEKQHFTMGERKKFQQCLINLLKNGIESMQPTGELHISQTYSNGMIEIHIQDQGKGMTKEQINRLGEPYFTTKEKGTGLGMMVSYSIIKGMNGTIDVTSEIEKGTRFILKLPIIHS
jgi:two-component system, sporulation sensor kinase B